MKFVETIFSQLPGFLFGVAATLLIAMGSGFIKEFFEERSRRAKHKRNVARQVLKICNEASTRNFRNAPRNQEHIYSVLTDLDGVNQDMGLILNSFVNLWGIIIEYTPNKGQEEAGEKHYTKMLNDVEEKRKIIVVWANKITSGT